MNVRTAICLCAATLGVIVLTAQPALAQAKSGTKPEAIEPAPKSTEPTGDLAFARFIALIRGHLLTGDELVKLHQWNVAYPHFTFPTEEIYGIIRDELRGYRTPPFDGALKALARAVRTRSAAQYPKALEKVDAALAAADAALKSRQFDWPRFSVAVAVEVLKAAADEYEGAFARGRIVHSIGYRTARGFILQADHMVASAAPQLQDGDAAALADIRAGLAQIKQSFVSINAPDRPTLDEKGLYALVSQVELAAGKFAPGRHI